MRGKVTSSGKRASPSTVANSEGRIRIRAILPTADGNLTTEREQDDGSYGDSVDYIYWWDVNGVYHQHFFTSEQIILVRSQPLPNPPRVILRFDQLSGAANE